MKIYQAHTITQLQQFYQAEITDMLSYPSIQAHLDALAIRMFQGVREDLHFIKQEISNYHQDYLGKAEDIDPDKFDLEDCRQAIANEYGFDNWGTLENLVEASYDPEFEKAVDLLLSGKLSKLKSLIENNPRILVARSSYGHQATLLHYAGSNGVELWRQQVPMNLAEIVNFLIDAGADKAAHMKVYGGHFDTYALLTTSIHPKEAGIMEAVKRVMKT